jgi:class 3 adenylate cyclase
MYCTVEKFLPPNIVAQIMVQHSPDIDENLLGRKEAVLKYHKGDATALITEEMRKIKVQVKGKDEIPYITILRETIKDIFNTYNIKPVLSYEVLSGNTKSADPSIVEEDILRYHLESGLLYSDYKSKETIPLDETGLRYGLYTKEEIETKNNRNSLYLKTRLHPKAIKNLDKEKLLEFSSNEEMEMAVMSIDIRKSQEIMLRANTPEEYANFISGLTEKLKTIILDSYGVYDKFTGDGILAYFPVFYSGTDGIKNCCIASQQCHDAFRDFYRECYGFFETVLVTGLGIGIDYGMAKLLVTNKELTILGSSVVSACRISAAPAGKTYLNITAYKKLKERGIILKEVEMNVKSEGAIIVYELGLINEKDISIPYWAR